MTRPNAAYPVVWSEDDHCPVCKGGILFAGTWLPSHKKPENPFFVAPEIRAIAEAMWAERKRKLS